MGWIAVDMVRDMDKLCEKPTCIEEQIQGAVPYGGCGQQRKLGVTGGERV